MSGRDLSAAHDAMRERCRLGEWAELASLPDGDGDGDGDDELPDYDDEDFWRGHTIDGAWLAAFLTSADSDVHRRGVLVCGARIAGGLDLEGADLPRRLALIRCQLGPHPLDLQGSRTRLVDLSGLRCSELRGAGLEVGGTLVLGHGFRADGPVTLTRATIDGDLVGDGGRFLSATTSTGPADPSATTDDAVVGSSALELSGVHVTGSVLLRGAIADGAVRLRDAKVGGILDCSGAHLTGTRTDEDDGRANGVPRTTRGRADGVAFVASRTEVGGSIFLSDGFEATGEVRLVSVRAGGDLDLSGARLTNPGATALSAARARIAGSLLLLRGFSTEGRLRISGATFGGDIHCVDGRFAGASGPVLEGAGIQVAGALRLIDGTTLDGEVHLVGASVGGDLDCRGSHLHNPDGLALDARNARVTGNVLLRDDFEARGVVFLVGVTIGANLECTGGHLTDRRSSALNVGGAHIEGSIYLNRGFRADGQVRMLGTVVGGSVMCTGGTIDNPGGIALIADNIRCAGSIYLLGGFTARGEVRVPGATIGGNLDCAGARLDNPGATALAAHGARVAGTVILNQGMRTDGLIRLADADAAALRDDRSSWPDHVDLDGFRYGRLDCPPADRGWRARSEWLRRQPRPGAQGYLQLAGVYQAAGDELDARKTRIERHNVLLDPPAHWRDQLPDGLRGLSGRLWRRLLRATIGHGFEPARALLIAVPLVLAMSLWYEHARQDDMLIPNPDAPTPLPEASTCDDTYPCVQPLVYALDNLVPILDFGQRSRWAPDQSHTGAAWWDNGRWLATATWVTGAVGWILATLAAASFTQVIRRE